MIRFNPFKWLTSILQPANTKYRSTILYLFAKNRARWCNHSNGNFPSQMFKYVTMNAFYLIFICKVSFSLQIDFDISGHWPEPIVYGSLDDWSSNLKTILDWSPFTSKDELMLQVYCILLFIHKIFSPNKNTHGRVPFQNNVNQFSEKCHMSNLLVNSHNVQTLLPFILYLWVSYTFNLSIFWLIYFTKMRKDITIEYKE